MSFFSTENFIALFGIVFACDGFWRVVERKFAKKDVRTKAILALLHDKLFYLCEKHIIRGDITVEEFDNLTYLFKPYEEMGGNGTCKRLYDECANLPKRKS